jgi:hypothetical protein
MRLVLTEFVMLDGVSQGPGSPAEDTSDGFTRCGWLVPFIDEMFVRRTSEWLDLADWQPTTVLGAFAGVEELKARSGRELQLHGAPGWGMRC